jgi:hypothetical protein
MKKITFVLIILVFSYVLVGYSPVEEPVKEVVLPHNSIVSVAEGVYTFEYNGELYEAKSDVHIESKQFKIIFTTQNNYIHNLFINNS